MNKLDKILEDLLYESVYNGRNTMDKAIVTIKKLIEECLPKEGKFRKARQTKTFNEAVLVISKNLKEEGLL